MQHNNGQFIQRLVRVERFVYINVYTFNATFAILPLYGNHDVNL